MAEQLLTAEVGRTLGTRPSRRLRREGKIPATVYGLGADPVSVAVEQSALRSVLTTDAGLNALIDLDVDGDRQLSIVKELQRHPVRNDVIHVDFIRIDPDEEIEVEVPITLEGEAKEVIAANGMVDQAMFSLTVLAKPNAIPNEFVVDVSALTVGDSIRVADLTLPEGARTEVELDDAIAMGTVTRSTLDAIAEEEAAEAAALLESEYVEGAEGAEPAEGDDAAGGGSDDSDD